MSAGRTGLVDLHTHSSRSDGSERPAALVEAAHRAGVTTLALTDHDTAAGIPEAARAAARRGIHFVAGVELALGHRGRHVHVLGLGFTAGDRREPMGRLLQRVQEGRVERNLAIVERMRRGGLSIDYDEVEARARGASVGRPHLARLLVERGAAATVADAFRRLLGAGCPFHVPRRAVPLQDAIEALRAAGGHGVLAHPAGGGDGELAELLRAVQAAGVTGVEAYHPSLSRERSALIRTLAGRLGLFVTGGSDWHGAHAPERMLGCWQPGAAIPQEAAAAFAEDRPRRG